MLDTEEDPFFPKEKENKSCLGALIILIVGTTICWYLLITIYLAIAKYF